MTAMSGPMDPGHSQGSRHQLDRSSRRRIGGLGGSWLLSVDSGPLGFIAEGFAFGERA